VRGFCASFGCARTVAGLHDWETGRHTVSVRAKIIIRKSARFGLAALLVVGAVVSAPAPHAAGTGAVPGIWSFTGAMSQARGFAPTVRLADGSVLTAGGTDGLSFTAAAERWTSSGAAWVSAGSIGQAEAGGIGALLPNGKALFAGGAGDVGYYGFGDLYNPTANSWTQTPAMAHPHAYGASGQLGNGDVLVVAGMDGSDSMTTNAVDLYSAAGNSWSAAQALPGVGRYALTATALAGGKILVAGGNDGTSGGTAAMSAVAIYDSTTGWTAAEAMKVARFDHAAVRLNDGRILVAGGSSASGTALASAEIYDPATGHWTLTGSMGQARYGMTLTLLGNGTVLVAGGYSSGSSPALNSTELFDPTLGGWTPTGAMQNGRRYASATVLNDGSVLVAGGHSADGDSFLNTAEVYIPPLVYPATTFHPLTPVRLMDTRVGVGLVGKFANRVPRQLMVKNRGGVPPSAIAVTGIVTVTLQSMSGYVSVGPEPTSMPGSSTLNFPLGDNRANNITTGLDSLGRLAFVLCGAGGMTASGSTDLIFDVTGYFTADDSGATYKTLTPARLMDSRLGTGLSSAGAFSSKVAKTMTIWGAGGVPAGAVAVTGNFTVTGPTASGWAFAGPYISSDPTNMNCSMVNAKPGDTKADGVTVALSGTGTLSFVWVGGASSTAHLIFDVTGYFVSGLSGARFVPMNPVRVADTRTALPVQGPVAAASPVVVPIAGKGDIPKTAIAMSGNLTVVSQTADGYLTVAPVATTTTTPTSTLNVPVGDIRANGFEVSLASNGSVGVVYFPAPGSSTHFVMDLTGYFLPALS
jgi:hypothetical protein